MLHQTSNRHIHAVMNNLKFIILDYLVAKKHGILDCSRDFCDWSKSSHSIWKAMPSRHLRSAIHLGIMLYTRTFYTDQQTETVVRGRA